MALHAVAAEDAACVGHQASTGSSWVVLRVQAVLRAGSAMTASHACWWCTARGRGAGEPLEGRLVGAAAELAELAAVLQDVSDGVARTVGRIDAAGRRLRKERGERADLEAAIAARDERLAEAHCDLDDVRRHADARRRADSAIKAAKNRAARDLGSSSTPAPPPPPSDDESVYTWFAAPQSIGASRAPPAKPAAKLVAAEKLPRTVASAGRGARLARGAKGVAPPPAPGKGKRAPSATRGYTHKASAPTPSRSAKATQPRAKPAPKPAAAAEKKETREGPGAVPAPEVGADEVEACEAAVARLEEAQAQDEAALDSFVKEGVWARMAARYAQLKRSGGLVPPDPPAVKACDDDVATDGDTWAHLCAALDAQRAEGAGAASMCDAGSGYAKHAASSATEMLQLIEEYQDVAGGEGTREVWQVLLALWFSTDWFLTAGTEATQRCILREELEWVEAVGRVFPGADGDVEQKHQDVVDDYLSHLDLGDADDASGSDEDVPPTPPPQADDAWRTDCDAHPRACAASALRHAEECILRPLLDLDHGTWGTAAGDLERLALLRLGSCVLMHKALFLPPVVGA
eukprot:TRINITY_DN11017_c0_g1_i1.p1 TRINITY_DN11017_c0_g1~~TRINITY_DN11017_c0_g1_i1.p1  ORF type:complete len:585 (+),score=144.27 TRINITY_DN11017_c0_g1_i1:27-1757(+)